MFALEPWLLAQAVWLNTPTVVLILVVLGSLILAMGIGELVRRQPETAVNQAVVRMFILRIRAWLLLCAILGGGILLGAFGVKVGRLATVFLFFGLSFWALREFITLTPTRVGDHRALFWVFFIFTPIQYLLVALDVAFIHERYLYRIYSIFLPLYGSLFVLTRVALAGDFKRFLERTAKIQLGLMICVYTLSFAPALLGLELISSNQRWVPPQSRVLWSGSNAGVLFYFILVVQLGDVMQFAWDRLLGKHVIAPNISGSKTWEGFIGGVLSTMLLGMLLWWVTPFAIWEAAGMSFACVVAGFAGNMTMSAIKRDRGVTDYGTLVQGHAGVLDRIDSTCFAAPVFYHLTRMFFSKETKWPDLCRDLMQLFGGG